MNMKALNVNSCAFCVCLEYYGKPGKQTFLPDTLPEEVVTERTIRTKAYLGEVGNLPSKVRCCFGQPL